MATFGKLFFVCSAIVCCALQAIAVLCKEDGLCKGETIENRAPAIYTCTYDMEFNQGQEIKKPYFKLRKGLRSFYVRLDTLSDNIAQCCHHACTSINEVYKFYRHKGDKKLRRKDVRKLKQEYEKQYIGKKGLCPLFRRFGGAVPKLPPKNRVASISSDTECNRTQSTMQSTMQAPTQNASDEEAMEVVSAGNVLVTPALTRGRRSVTTGKHIGTPENYKNTRQRIDSVRLHRQGHVGHVSASSRKVPVGGGRQRSTSDVGSSREHIISDVRADKSSSVSDVRAGRSSSVSDVRAGRSSSVSDVRAGRSSSVSDVRAGRSSSVSDV
eukprot:Lankesteria_metandrocarpae@DN4427_c0_g1_i1.p1